MSASAALQSRVVEPSASRRGDALAAIFGGSREQARRFVDLGRTDGPHLLLAVPSASGAVAHAAILCAYPGRTAMLLATAPKTPIDCAAVEGLVREAIRRAPELGALMIQALLEPLRAQERRVHEAAGMRVIGTLAYLERARNTAPPRASLPDGARVRAWHPSERALLECLLAETYIESLDCPGLSQLRPTSDILDGHLRSGTPDFSRWLIMELDGIPSGVSLVSEIPSTHCMELVYFGLAKRARGIGLGRALLDATLERTAGESVTLACDEANVPAMRLYRSRAFRTHLRRTALVAPAARVARSALPTTYPRRVDNAKIRA